MINNLECPENHPIYSVEPDLGSAIFYYNVSNENNDHEAIVKNKREEEKYISVEQKLLEEKWWNLNFDGAVSKEGARACICINGPNNDYKICSYK